VTFLGRTRDKLSLMMGYRAIAGDGMGKSLSAVHTILYDVRVTMNSFSRF